jgi:adenine-specific DNA-methyltransferase
MQAHPNFESKRQLGAYYTPGELSDILSNYLITAPTETLLEPSFGGGGILKSALCRFKELGCSDPERQLYGCDIDSFAFQNLNKVVRNKFAIQTTRFVKKDFLTLTADHFAKSNFDLVIANPPYIGYGQMSHVQRARGKELQQQFALNGSKASTWYFFLLKSLRYLKEGGKIAFVLPYALIDSNYAESLRRFIGNKFSHAAVYIFSNKIFSDQGTNERVLVLVAEGWYPEQNFRHLLQAIQVESFLDFEKKLYMYREKGNFGKRFLGSKIGRVKGRLNNSDINLINTYLEGPYISKLGSHINVRIGLVAGDAKFFTFNGEKADLHDLGDEKYLLPLMRSLRNHNSLSFRKSHFRSSDNNGDHCYLLNYSEDLLRSDKYRRYLESYDFSTISDNKTLSNREIWCQVNDGKIPDFFIPYMSIEGPRLVLNTYKANCLNNIHRGYVVNSGISLAEKKLLSISILTSFTQLVTEMEAKLYGSDTLKLEPGLYERLPLLIPDIKKCDDIIDAFEKIDKLFKNKNFDEVVEAASGYIYEKIFGVSLAKELKISFRSMLEKMKKYRIKR